MELNEVFEAQTNQMTKSEVVEMLQFLVGEYHKLEQELNEAKDFQHNLQKLQGILKPFIEDVATQVAEAKIDAHEDNYSHEYNDPYRWG